MLWTPIRKLAVKELMKLPARFNITFVTVMLGIVTLQVLVEVKMELASEMGTFSVERVYQAAGRFVNNLAYTFIPVLFLINLSREFEYHVVHRSLISGLSRSDYFIAKLIQLVFFAFFSLIVFIQFRVIIAAGFGLPMIWDWGRILFAFLVPFYLGCFGMLFVYYLKRTNYAIILYAAYVVLDNSVSIWLHTNDINVSLPFTMCVKMLGPGVYNGWTFVVMGVSMVVFVGVGYRRFRRSDLW